MKRIGLLMLVFTVALGAVGVPVHATNLEQEMQESLVRIRNSKDPDSHRMQLEQLQRQMLIGGYRSFPHLCSLLADRPEDISTLPDGRAMLEMDPTRPDLLFASLGTEVKRGNLRLVTGRMLAGLQTLAGDPTNMIGALLAVIRSLSALLFWLLAFFGVVGIAKYGRNLFHDLQHVFSNRIETPYLLYTLIALVFMLPVALLVHPRYLPVYWALLFTAYMKRREFRLMVVTVAAGVLASVLAAYAGAVAWQTGTKSYLYVRSLQVPFSQVEGFQPQPDLERFAAATNRLRRGEYTEAISAYKELDSSSPLYPLSLNNIGVAYFRLNEFQLAGDFFREAMQRDPDQVMAGYNLSTVLLHGYDLEESGAELSGAFQKAPEAVLTALTTQLEQASPVILVPDVRSLYGNLFRLTFLDHWSWSRSTGSMELLFLLFFGGIAAGLRFLFRDADLSVACGRCGRPYRFFESHHNTMCKQCVSVFVKKDNVDSGRRMSKVQSIRSFNQVRRAVEAVIGILVPGSWGMFVVRRPVRGWLLFVLFFWSVTVALSGLRNLNSWVLVSPLWLAAGVLFLRNGLMVAMELKQED